MSYAALIRSIDPARDPRHIEAWMREEHGTLDGLTPEAFRREVAEAAVLVDADPDLSEKLAESYGLKAVA